MISATCFTNLDDFRYTEWPKGFAALPRIGDRVEGVRGEFRPVLKVIGITHGWDTRNHEPKITIELHR